VEQKRAKVLCRGSIVSGWRGKGKSCNSPPKRLFPKPSSFSSPHFFSLFLSLDIAMRTPQYESLRLENRVEPVGGYRRSVNCWEAKRLSAGRTVGRSVGVECLCRFTFFCLLSFLTMFPRDVIRVEVEQCGHCTRRHSCRSVVVHLVASVCQPKSEYHKAPSLAFVKLHLTHDLESFVLLKSTLT